MQMDKCFCHFNGYRVKDAEARQMIENLSKIKETNNGYPISFWVGTTEQFEKIEHPVENCFYIFSDDKTAEELQEMLQTMTENIAGANNAAGEAANAADAAMEKAVEAANAAASANDLAVAAQDTAVNTLYGVTPYFIVEEVGALSWSPATGTGMELDFLEAEVLNCHRFRNLQMIFISVQLTIQGKMEKGETVKFVQTGKYKPYYFRNETSTHQGAELALRFPLSQSGAFTHIPIAASIASDGVYFTAIDAIDTSAIKSGNIGFQFSGWYMYDLEQNGEEV